MVIGIDEVGRGCWAGPLVVVAVALSETIPGLADSKLLSKVQREKLARKIRAKAKYISIAWVASELVDTLGLSNAMKTACRFLYDQSPTQDVDEVIIDGSINYLPGTNATAIVGADAKMPAVSAASIIAKVARDRYMCRIAEQYPGYGFERHVGYGTSAHKLAIEQYGICSHHRRSFSPIKAPV